LLFVSVQQTTSQFCQHYQAGTQENYNSFASKNIMMDKELEFPEWPGRGKGEPPGSP
jgi:hypothetical protein